MGGRAGLAFEEGLYLGGSVLDYSAGSENVLGVHPGTGASIASVSTHALLYGAELGTGSSCSISKFVVGVRKQIVIAMDWTEFDDDDHSTLCAYLVTNHGRARMLRGAKVRRAREASVADLE